MQELRSPAQEAAEDIFFGQVVIIWARWCVILTVTILALWLASSVNELTGAMLLVVALMAINFFMHGRYLTERPANRDFLLVMSLLDIVIITAIVAFQSPGGVKSPYFIFYFPVLVAFAFVFPAGLTVAYTGVALVAYAVSCLLADPSIVGSASELKPLVMRLITLASMGGLGTYYWRIQRDRRRAAHGGSEAIPELRPAHQAE